MPETFRIRRCRGNPAAWYVVRLRSDGAESDLFCDCSTQISDSGLLTHAEALTAQGHKVEFQLAPRVEIVT